MVTRIQALVLGFLVLAWVGLLAILALAPDMYDQTLRLSPVDRRPAEFGFVSAVSLFLAVLGVDVVRRWRWTFWLVLVAFLSGGRSPRRGRSGTWSCRRSSAWCSSGSGC